MPGDPGRIRGVQRPSARGTGRRSAGAALGGVGDRLGTGAADRGGDDGGIPYRALAGGRPVDLRRVRAVGSAAPARPSRFPTSTCARRARAGSEPRNPRAASAASCAVSSTTSGRREVSARTWANAASQSVSMSSGSIGAIVSTRRDSSAGPSTPCTRPRTRGRRRSGRRGRRPGSRSPRAGGAPRTRCRGGVRRRPARPRCGRCRSG